MYLDGIVIGGIAVLAFIFWRCFYTVQEGECALITSFGKPIKGSDGIVGPGLHFKFPWQQAHIVSLRERLAPISNDAAHALLARDGTPLRIDATVRYQIQPEHIERQLFGFEEAKAHLDNFYQSILRTAIANFDVEIPNTAGTSFEVLRRERRQLVDELNRQYQAQLAERYGISFKAVDVYGISPPQELEDALNAILQAQTAANSQRDHAEALSEQRLIAAENAVKLAQSKANAIREEIEILGTHLSSVAQKGTLADYVHHRRAEILSQSKTIFVRSE